MEELEIALRCHNKPKNKSKNSGYYVQDVEIYPNRVLIFDTETTIDKFQNLKFGYYEIYENRNVEDFGLFFSENLNSMEKEILTKFSQLNDIPLFPVEHFVDEIFYLEIYDLKSLCIGFNLPFDISRLAIHFGKSRKNGFENAFSFQLSEKPFFPRIIIKHLDSTKSFIQFTNRHNFNLGNRKKGKVKSQKYQGRFLDLRTLGFSLTNEKFSLKDACEHFQTPIKKMDIEEHGKINPEYINYNIQDVKSTYQLYLKMREEFQKFNIDTEIHKVFSPASIGKAYLSKMGVRPFLDKNPEFPDETLGNIMNTFYGGRSEVRIRKTPVQVAYMDVLSMYPTVCTLQGLWKFVICDSVKYSICTEDVSKFVLDVTLEDLQNPDIWKNLTVICLVKPDGDILPLRSKYSDKNTYNIGLNRVTSEEPIWYTLSDVIASKLLEGKAPEIIKAYRFEPIGTQKDLKKIEIIDRTEFDPTHADLFKTLIEKRRRIKSKMNIPKSDPNYDVLDSQQNILKIITNSTSYGIFIEMNIKQFKKPITLEIFSQENYEISKDRIEKPGKMFNPIMATFITSASRLILAITEAILMKHNETYAFCDTDSMAVPKEYVPEIQNFFSRLNPYDFDAQIFELEPENFMDGELEPLYFYGISAKRYVLYNMVDGEIRIRKHSSHGLGHILNPFNDNNDWKEEVWMDILKIHYGKITYDSTFEKYKERYALSKLGITSPSILDRLKTLNDGKPYNKQIKPFNFLIVGISNDFHPSSLDPVKPIIPYSKDYHLAPYSEFVDYNSGDTLSGIQYWKSMDNVFFDYLNHPESKFKGKKGILERRHIKVKGFVNIGKESNRLDETSVLGVSSDDYLIYSDKDQRLKRYQELFDRIDYKDAERVGIDHSNFYAYRKMLREGIVPKFSKPTLKKLRTLL